MTIKISLSSMRIIFEAFLIFLFICMIFTTSHVFVQVLLFFLILIVLFILLYSMKKLEVT